MCGIGGIVRLDGAPVDAGRLARMSGQLQHRGPDESQVWTSDRGDVGLVHTRLSIIDLAGSHQPMTSADGRLVLAFNGEVLNYRELRRRLDYPFTTDGDTETILATHVAHGTDAPRRLAGQFAYALHDAGDRTLTLVRDRLGILPLFYARQGPEIVFASEVPALVAGLGHVPALDRTVLAEYLRDRYVSSPRTLLTGVRKLRPGTTLTFPLAGSTGTAEEQEVEFWSPSQTTVVDLDPASALDRLDHLLDTALRRALVADVPVGAYLSGGVDSSLIVAKARAAGAERLHTYCASVDDPRYDETEHAEAVSRHVGTVHQTVPVGPADFLDTWADLSLRRGAPLGEPSDVALYQLARRAREDVKVVLSGEGSDELFGGYPKARFAAATARARALPPGLRGSLLRSAERALPASRRRAAVALRALAEPTFEDRVAGWFATFTSAEVRELGLDPAVAPALPDGTPLRRMLHHDLRGYLPDNLLERGDRMSMAASLELRPPFLDVDVVDFSLTLPDDLLVRGGTTKWLVKEVARRHVPASVIDRPKVGFRVPLDTWFRGDFRSMTRDVTSAADGVTRRHLDGATVARLLDEHESGRRDNSVKLWTLASLEVWHRQLDRALEEPHSGPA